MKCWVLVFVCCQFGVRAQFQFNFTDFIPVVADGQNLSKAWDGGLNTPQFSSLDYDYDGDEADVDVGGRVGAAAQEERQT